MVSKSNFKKKSFPNKRFEHVFIENPEKKEICLGLNPRVSIVMNFECNALPLGRSRANNY